MARQPRAFQEHLKGRSVQELLWRSEAPNLVSWPCSYLCSKFQVGALNPNNKENRFAGNLWELVGLWQSWTSPWFLSDRLGSQQRAVRESAGAVATGPKSLRVTRPGLAALLPPKGGVLLQRPAATASVYQIHQQLLSQAHDSVCQTQTQSTSTTFKLVDKLPVIWVLQQEPWAAFSMLL